MKSVLQIFLLLKNNSLFRNSFWLMLGSFSMAGIGFFYWLIAARLYTPTEIGLATTFLSSATLINSFAILGFNTTLVRYLPSSQIKEKKINTAFTMIAGTALILGIIYLLGLPLFTEKLVFLRSSFSVLLILAAFFPVNALNAITDSVFTAYRETKFVFISNVLQSLAKIVVLLFLPALGIWGVMGSNMIGIMVAVIFCCYYISVRYKINFKPQIDKEVIQLVKKYTFINYISSLIIGLPTLIFPVLITNRISPEQTAYFYMPNMIAGLLAVVPATISKSYFSESSQVNKAAPITKPILLTYSILIPLVVILFIFGKSILFLFGKNYSTGGYSYLILTAFSVLISVFSYFLTAKLQIDHEINKVLCINIISTIFYILLAWSFTSNGINGIAVASILSQAITLIILIYLTRKDFINLFNDRRLFK